MKLVRDHEEHFLAVSTGVVKVDKSGITVLADTAENADEILEEEVEKARAEAQKVMTNKQANSVEFAQAAALLERETARLKAVRRRKRTGT